MELVFYSVVLAFFVIFFSLSLYIFFNKERRTDKNLPPGRSGLPLIGETFEYISAGRKGHPEKFIFDRLAKYSSNVFRTSLLGFPAVVLCGLPGNKFVFSNEKKLFKMWYPSSMEKYFISSRETGLKEEVSLLKKTMHSFLKPEVLQRFIGVMDEVTQRHFACNWENKAQVMVCSLADHYTFHLACRLFLSVEDPHQFADLEVHFGILLKGLMSFPINFPGTPYYRAIKSSNFVRKKLLAIVKQRRMDIEQGTSSTMQDIMSHMLSTIGADGKLVKEEDVADKILGLLFAGHETTSSSISTILHYLTEMPEVYQGVYEEQMEIANSKAAGELLNREDIKMMKYSWNVACEVMRLAPTARGGFRESVIDFNYNGFTVPKGFKVHWSTHSSHMDSDYFPEPLKFDPSRFDGSGPPPYSFVPFGGGPRMCPGKEYARLEILVFIHNLVKRFKWEKVIPDEKLVLNPTSRPEKGLPVRLYPHSNIRK